MSEARIILHSGVKGMKWKNHKYITEENGQYNYGRTTNITGQGKGVYKRGGGLGTGQVGLGSGTPSSKVKLNNGMIQRKTDAAKAMSLIKGKTINEIKAMDLPSGLKYQAIKLAELEHWKEDYVENEKALKAAKNGSDKVVYIEHDADGKKIEREGTAEWLDQMLHNKEDGDLLQMKQLQEELNEYERTGKMSD